MMKEKPSTLGKDLKILIQTTNHELEQRLTSDMLGDEITFQTITSSDKIEQLQEGHILSFIIGGDVPDPIQSAQRLHTHKKNAKIVFLTQPEQLESLRETVKFSPFIGSDVHCLDESEAGLESHIQDILQSSLQAQRFKSIKDETKRKLSAGAVSHKSTFNQQFINKLMDVAPIGIAIVGRLGKIYGWNKEATQIFDYSEAQILGKPISRFFGPEETNRFENYLRDSFKQRKSESLVVERTYTDSSKQILSFTAASFWLSGETEKALILAFKDITDRKKAEEELREINETLEERVQQRTQSLLSYQSQLRSLASKLSKAEEKERHRLATELHDNLGQMLAVNKMKIDLLPRAQLPRKVAEEVEEIKEGMNDAIIYTRNLMSDLKPPPSLDKEDVRASIKWVANKMETHGLKVTIEDDEQPKDATENIRTTLLQAVRELLFNIIKHAGVDEAKIRMSRRDGRVRIAVQDRGKGMSGNTLDTASRETAGYGLFNISERIDLLGGRIQIDSEPGEGTTVILEAPLKEAEAAMHRKQLKETSSPTPAKQKTKVMLVDDHKVMREGLKNIVDKEEDMSVVAEASDGEEAVEMAPQADPDVIIMDVNMPQINGIEATQQILSEMPDVRVVGLSLHETQQVVESLRDAGASAYLSKSEAFETLCATIRSESPGRQSE